MAPKSRSTAAELRQHEQQEKQHDAGRGEQHEGRILHRIGEFAAQQLGPRPLRSQHLEHLIERTRYLADANQRHIHGGKQGRVMRDRVGEAFARQKRGP